MTNMFFSAKTNLRNVFQSSANTDDTYSTYSLELMFAAIPPSGKLQLFTVSVSSENILRKCASFRKVLII